MDLDFLAITRVLTCEKTHNFICFKLNTLRLHSQPLPHIPNIPYYS